MPSWGTAHKARTIKTAPLGKQLATRGGEAGKLSQENAETARRIKDQACTHELAQSMGGFMDVEMLILSLYSWPDDRPDSFDKFACKFRARVEMVDTLVRKEKWNILEDTCWARYEEKLNDGAYDGGLIASRCSSFTPCRKPQNDEPDGPSLLRAPDPPEIYGLDG